MAPSDVDGELNGNGPRDMAGAAKVETKEGTAKEAGLPVEEDGFPMPGAATDETAWGIEAGTPPTALTECEGSVEAGAMFARSAATAACTVCVINAISSGETLILQQFTYV